MAQNHEVPVENLRWQCDPGTFKFDCTQDLAPLHEFIGQERAIRAVDFGLNVTNDGFNIYVSGLTGTGKTSMVKFYIEKLIKDREAHGETFKIDDWCYLHNFQDADLPQIVSLPKGEGRIFRDKISELLNNVKNELGKAFTSEEYKEQSKRTVEEGRTRQQKVFEEIVEEARRAGFALQMTPLGPILIPLVDGHPMEESAYLKLDERARKKLESKQAELRSKLQSVIERATRVERETAESLKQADKQIGEYTVGGLFAPLFETYDKYPKINQYLTDLKKYTLDHLDVFKGGPEQIHPLFGIPVSQVMGGRNPFLPYEINFPRPYGRGISLFQTSFVHGIFPSLDLMVGVFEARRE